MAQVVYLRAFPWAITPLSASEIGPGTAYPEETGMDVTHDIYWQTRSFSITGTVTASDANETVTIEVTGDGAERAENPASLIDPTAGVVFADGESELGTYITEMTFQMLPQSGGDSIDFREQHLAMSGSGFFSTKLSPSPTDIPQMNFSTISSGEPPIGSSVQQVGYLSILDLQIPIYAVVPDGCTLSVTVQVRRQLWTAD